MKKIIIFIFIILVNITQIYSYNPTDSDYKNLEKVYKKINLLTNGSELKIKLLVNRIKELKKSYKQDSKIYFLLNELEKYFEKSLNVSTTNNLSTSNINNCSKTLWELVSNYDKQTVTVNSYDELKNTINSANNRLDKNKWYEIIIKKWTYNLKNWFQVKWDNIIVRWETWNREDIILKWKWMKWWISHWFWVSWTNVIIWDLSIWEVANHAVQIHWEKNADNFWLYNTKIFNTWEQMIKWSYWYNDLWTDNWIIQCSKFLYTAWIWPQFYIWWIDVHHWKNWIVKDNVFKDIISPENKLAEHAIHFWSNSEWTIVERNQIYNCDRWIWFWMSDRWHIWWIISNNVIYSNSSKWDVWIWLENSSWTKVLNNTVFLDNKYQNAIEYRFSWTKNVIIKNNLTNKLIKKRNSWEALLENNITDAKKDWFKSIDNYDFTLKEEYRKLEKLNWVWANIDVISYTDNFKYYSNTKNSNDTIYDNNNTEDELIDNVNIDTFENKWIYLRDVYVSINNWKEDWDGTKNNPYKTLKDIEKIVKPWDIIHLAWWIYPSNNYLKNFQWTEKNPIKILWEKNNEVIFKWWKTWIQFVNWRYLIIRNITINWASDNGLNIDDWWDYKTPANHILIDNVKITNIWNWWNQDNLKLSWLNDFWIINSTFTNWSSGWSWIDMVWCHRWIISNNRLENMWNNFIQIKWWSSDITINDNFMKNVLYRWINMWWSTWEAYFRPSIKDWTNFEAKNITVTKNIFVKANSWVAFVWCYKCTVTKNVFYKPKTWAFRILQETVNKWWVKFIASSEWIFSNNIIVFNNNIKKFVNIWSNTDYESFELDWNLWYCLDNQNFDYSSSKASLQVPETNSIIQKDPEFIDVINQNFNLKETSPMYKVFN